MFFILFLVAVPLILCVYVRLVAKKPVLFAKGSRFKNLLRSHCTVLNEPYVPPWWTPWGNMQTCFRRWLKSCPKMPYERETLTLHDGGKMALDWLHPDMQKDDSLTPIILILPGLTGNSIKSSYVLHVILEVVKLQYRSVVFNYRGTAGIKLVTPWTYAPGITEDLDFVISHINKKYPKAPILALGFSMGGTILFNYVCSKKTAEETGIKAGFAVSAVWDFMTTTISMERFIPRVLFNYLLCYKMQKYIKPYRHLFEQLVDWNKVRDARTSRDFDINFNVPVFGYESFQDYCKKSSFSQKIHKVHVPMLALNATDDCFAPVHAIPFDEIEKNENVAVIVTKHGGHTAFIKSFYSSAPGLIEQLFSEYAKMVFEYL